MAQDIEGAAGIASAEAFGEGGSVRPLQYIQGVAGIPSGESFTNKRTGLWIDPLSVPAAIWIAY
jgi:hypothetical protein